MSKINWLNIETIEDVVSNPLGDILYLHAFSGSYRNKIVLRNYFKDYNFYAVNMPGHGNSKFESDDEIDYLFYKDIIVEYILKHDLKDIILIGHSMGSGLALLVNNELSNRIKKIILETPSNPIALQDLIIIPKLIPYTYQEMKIIGSHLFYNPISFFVNEKNYERFLQKEFATLVNKKYLKKLISKPVLDNLSIYLNKSLPNLNTKTLILLGQYDEIVTKESGIEFFKNKPNIEIKIIENTKHVPVVEKSNLVLPMIKEFIENE